MVCRGAPDKLAGRTEACDVMMAKLVRSVPFTEKTESGNSMKSQMLKEDCKRWDFTAMFVRESTFLQSFKALKGKCFETPTQQPALSVY